MDMKDEILVSELMNQEKTLKPSEIMSALIRGEKIRQRKAPSGVNFYLEDEEIKSKKITYSKGLPMNWFDPDIKFVIDYE